MSETTNFQLIRAAKKYGIPLIAVCFKDELKYIRNLTKRSGYIINLANSNQEGTHWVALWVASAIADRKVTEAFYFDSFGIVPPIEVRQFAKRCGAKTLKYNTEQIQSINSGWCGEYCLDFLYFMSHSKHEPSKKFINQFTSIRLWNL